MLKYTQAQFCVIFYMKTCPN